MNLANTSVQHRHFCVFNEIRKVPFFLLGMYGMPSFLLPQGINGAENPANSFNESLGGLKNQQEEYFCRSRTSVDEYDKVSMTETVVTGG